MPTETRNNLSEYLNRRNVPSIKIQIIINSHIFIQLSNKKKLNISRIIHECSNILPRSNENIICTTMNQRRVKDIIFDNRGRKNKNEYT